MGKTKAPLNTDNPKWWDQLPKMVHVRNVEDALGDYLINIKLNPTDFQKDDIIFEDLLDNLVLVDVRWKEVKADDFHPSKHTCFKGLWTIVNRLKSNPKKIKELMESRGEVDDMSLSSSPPTKVIPNIPKHFDHLQM